MQEHWEISKNDELPFPLTANIKVKYWNYSFIITQYKYTFLPVIQHPEYSCNNQKIWW